MQPQENPARVLLGFHGDSTEGFLLKNLYCLECTLHVTGRGIIEYMLGLTGHIGDAGLVGCSSIYFTLFRKGNNHVQLVLPDV